MLQGVACILKLLPVSVNARQQAKVSDSLAFRLLSTAWTLMLHNNKEYINEELKFKS